MLQRSKHATRILLIEENEDFALRFIRAAGQAGVDVEWYDDLTECGTPLTNAGFHAVVAAMSSDPVSGLDIAEYADTFLPDLPLILIAEKSDTDLCASRWPASVQAIIPRHKGVASILESALDMAAVSEVEMPRRPFDHHLALRSHRALHS